MYYSFDPLLIIIDFAFVDLRLHQYVPLMHWVFMVEWMKSPGIRTYTELMFIMQIILVPPVDGDQYVISLIVEYKQHYKFPV